MGNKEIEKTAKELSKKATYIRSGFQKWLNNWAKVSECGEEIDAVIAYDSEDETKNLYLVTGKDEIQKWDYRDNTFYDYAWDVNSWDVMEINRLRNIIANIPEKIEKIKKEMQENMEFSDEILSFFKKFN